MTQSFYVHECMLELIRRRIKCAKFDVNAWLIFEEDLLIFICLFLNS